MLFYLTYGTMRLPIFSYLLWCDFSILHLEKLQKENSIFYENSLCISVNIDYLLLMVTIFNYLYYKMCHFVTVLSLRWVHVVFLKRIKFFWRQRPCTFYFCWIYSTVEGTYWVSNKYLINGLEQKERVLIKKCQYA